MAQGLKHTCGSQPEQDDGNEDHRQIVHRTLLVPCRYPTKLLKAVDGALHTVALAVGSPIKAPAPPFYERLTVCPCNALNSATSRISLSVRIGTGDS